MNARQKLLRDMALAPVAAAIALAVPAVADAKTPHHAKPCPHNFAKPAKV